MVPFSPTTHTSAALLPQTPHKSSVVPLSLGYQLVPFQLKMVPFHPTAHTSAALLPQTPHRGMMLFSL